MRLKKALFVILVVLDMVSLSTFSFAQEENTAKKTIWDKIHGFIEYRIYPYFHHNRDDHMVVNEAVGELKIQDKLGSYFDFLVAPRFIIDDDNMSTGAIDEWVDDDIKRNIFNINEWFLRFKKDHFSASIGKQIYAWGTADLFNPTDNLNARDFTDFIENEKIGALSLDMNYALRNWKFEFVMIPFFTPARLPLLNKRWSPLPEDFPLAVDERDIPAKSLENAQYASRISTTIGGWDLSASYYYGFEGIPTGLISMPIPMSVTPIYDKVRICGADFSTTIKGFEVHGETAYYRRDNKDRNDYLQFISGFNYTFSDIIRDQDAKVTLEYARDEIVRSGDNTARYADLELSHPFRNSVMTKLEYEFSYSKRIEISSVYNVNHEDFIIEPKFCYKPNDSWDFEVGFDILDGRSDSLFGAYARNDRGFVRTKYSF